MKSEQAIANKLGRAPGGSGRLPVIEALVLSAQVYSLGPSRNGGRLVLQMHSVFMRAIPTLARSSCGRPAIWSLYFGSAPVSSSYATPAFTVVPVALEAIYRLLAREVSRVQHMWTCVPLRGGCRCCRRAAEVQRSAHLRSFMLHPWR